MLCMLAVFLCMLLGGCGGGLPAESEETQAANEEEESVRIGMSFDSYVIERWIRDRDAFVSTAKTMGASVNVQNANGDVQEQISQIEYLMDKGIDVLVVIAADCNALSDVIHKAQDMGIKIISYDRLVQKAGCDLYVSFDNRAVGTLMAQGMKAAIPNGGDIYMIQGPEEDHNVLLVREGFEKELKGSNLNVVYEAQCEGWLAEKAADYVREALKKYPDVKGIMCGNDDIATQVIRVLAENRKAGEVTVVGQDGDLAACQRIVEGSQTMTVFKSVEKLAETAAEYAVQMAREEKLEKINTTIHDGIGEIPSCLLTPISVTSENMDEVIIDGGFHSSEDVYLNVPEKSQ